MNYFRKNLQTGSQCLSYYPFFLFVYTTTVEYIVLFFRYFIIQRILESLASCLTYLKILTEFDSGIGG